MLWVIGATSLCCGGAILRETLSDAAAIVVANVAIFLSLGCIGTACRALDARPASASWLAGPSLVWCAACLQPTILGDQILRVMLASMIVVVQMGWAVAEVWHGRADDLRARRWLAAPLALNGVASLGRTLGAGLSHDVPKTGLIAGRNLTAVALWALAFMMLTGFALVAAVTERRERRLRQAAGEDGLTGLGNRRQLDAALARAQRQASPIALLMVDVDAFKAYNDIYGHPAGDACLRAVARVLAATFALPSAIVVRYGGEEFAALLPDIDAAEALALATAALRGIRDLAIAHDGSEHGIVTVSIGVAADGPAADRVADDLLREADRTLYRAKHGGRNRVAIERAAGTPPG